MKSNVFYRGSIRLGEIASKADAARIKPYSPEVQSRSDLSMNIQSTRRHQIGAIQSDVSLTGLFTSLETS